MNGPDGDRGMPGQSTRAIILFDTRYGNTEKVAKALAKGMSSAGLDAKCANITEVDVSTLPSYDLLAVGGPTHYRTASQRMQAFLFSLNGVNLSGKMGFAFDTRKESFWAGSAAKYIEKELRSDGVRMVWPTTSAWVFVPDSTTPGDELLGKEEAKERLRGQVKLGEKMEEVFEKMGGQIAKSLAGPV